MWAVEIGDTEAARVLLPYGTLTGGLDTYPACQDAARRLRRRGMTRLAASSAALVAGGARAMRVDKGVRAGEPRDGATIVIFGPAPALSGWIAADAARPSIDLLPRVHHYRSSR